MKQSLLKKWQLSVAIDLSNSVGLLDLYCVQRHHLSSQICF